MKPPPQADPDHLSRCKGKKCFLSYTRAQQSLRKHLRGGGGKHRRHRYKREKGYRFRVYRCNDCQSWHIGRNFKSEVCCDHL